MSAFEPLGGILSANLPITYVLFANSFRKVKNAFSGNLSSPSKPLVRLSQGSSNRHGRGQDQDDQWIHLNAQASWSTDTKPLAYATQDT